MNTKFLAIPAIALLMSGCSTAPNHQSSNTITCVPYCHMYVNSPAPKCVEITPDGNIGACSNVNAKAIDAEMAKIY